VEHITYVLSNIWVSIIDNNIELHRVFTIFAEELLKCVVPKILGFSRGPIFHTSRQ